MPPKSVQKRSLIPQQVKWDESGAEVEGTLLDKEETMYMDNTRGRYLLSTVDGLRVVLGTFQIDQALKLVDIGESIGIKYIGEEGTSRGTKFKVFEIWVNEPEEVKSVHSDALAGKKEAAKEAAA